MNAELYMKNTFLLLSFFLLFPGLSFSQTAIQSGHLIVNDNSEVFGSGTCLTQNRAYSNVDRSGYSNNSGSRIGIAYENSFTQKKKSSRISLHFRPMITNSSINVYMDSRPILNFKFDRKTSYGVGILFEYTLPLEKDNWSVIVEPAYRSYNNEHEINGINFVADYTSVDVSLGLRYYILLDSDMKPFVNAMYGYLRDMDSQLSIRIQAQDQYFDFNIEPKSYFAAGGGVSYNKISGEVRYIFNHDIMKENTGWNYRHNILALIIGYRFLN